MADVDVTIDVQALWDLLNSADGPVGRMVQELSAQAATVALAKAPVRHTASWSARSNSWPPGYLKAHIRPHLGWGSRTGHIYGGVNAPMSPTIFLEYPARQMHRAYPFMTTALWELAGVVE